MSEINAELVAGASKFKLTAEAEKEDQAMKVDVQQRSEVNCWGHEKVGRGSEIVEEGAEFEAHGDGKMEDIVETLKQANSAINDGILKLETYLKAKVDYLQILEQQLATMETEKALTKVTEVEKESEGHVITPDPVKMAIEIPLILEIILGKLDYESLMDSRLVAKYWDEAALNVFSKTPTEGEPSRRLNLKKLFKSSDFNRIPELEPKLTKRIYFRGNCFCDDEEDSVCDCNTSKQKLIMFCEKFSAQIEEIDFHMSLSFALSFLNAISNGCPNLKALYLDNYPEQDQDLIEMEAIIPQEQLFRMNLNTIRFYNGYGHQPTSFYEPLQRIIDRSPNLNKLVLEANYCPNLTNNKYLKHLCFHGQLDCPNFSHTKFSEMLDQVKDSLKVLEIWTQEEEEDSERQNPKSFSFPVMKMLKQLVILDVFWHLLEQDGSNIIQTIASQFPNLEHLGIASPEESCVMFNKAKQDPLISLFKIQTLFLYSIQNPSVLTYFSSWFPNLNKLRFSMPENVKIGAVFSALGGLKLKHFSFRIGFHFRFSDLVKALVLNPELFKGLDVLEIHADADEGICDDLGIVVVMENGKRKTPSQVFCDWLRNTTKKMKTVTFHDFNFSGERAMEVIRVIVEHQLPVNFTNN